MGVIARLLGRSKPTPETSAAEAQAGAEPEASETESAKAETAEAEAVAAEAEAAGSAEDKGSAEDGGEHVAARSDTDTDDGSEGSGIPKQQSAGEAADNEAGEGAHR